MHVKQILPMTFFTGPPRRPKRQLTQLGSEQLEQLEQKKGKLSLVLDSSSAKALGLLF